MQSTPLEFVSHTHYCSVGEVVVDASAVVAPGVVLQALPGASIHVGACVCLGAGVVLQAKAGALVLESGVSLGVGVLVVGHGRVGRDACVGTATTLINPKIESGAVIPPNTLIGDNSRATGKAQPSMAANQSSAESRIESVAELTDAHAVYGRAQMDSLLSALFPHRQADLGNGTTAQNNGQSNGHYNGQNNSQNNGQSNGQYNGQSNGQYNG
jgi:carbonic anhydrase/acetyltransferase-like protein (isoleucine patch superfamily)